MTSGHKAYVTRCVGSFPESNRNRYQYIWWGVFFIQVLEGYITSPPNLIIRGVPIFNGNNLAGQLNLGTPVLWCLKVGERLGTCLYRQT